MSKKTVVLLCEGMNIIYISKHLVMFISFLVFKIRMLYCLETVVGICKRENTYFTIALILQRIGATAQRSTGS